MITLFIRVLQIQSTTTIEILFILLAETFVGFLYLHHYKLVYKNQLIALEIQKDQLVKQNQILHLQKKYLHFSIREKSNEIAQLISEVNVQSAKADHIQYVKKKSSSKIIKGMLYFDWLGSVPKNQVINLIPIKGIGLWVEEKVMPDIITSKQINKLVKIDMMPSSDITAAAKDFNQKNGWDFQVSELAKKQFHQEMN